MGPLFSLCLSILVIKAPFLRHLSSVVISLAGAVAIVAAVVTPVVALLRQFSQQHAFLDLELTRAGTVGAQILGSNDRCLIIVWLKYCYAHAVFMIFMCTVVVFWL